MGSWGAPRGVASERRDAASAFAQTLTHLADNAGTRLLSPLIERLQGPVRVAVGGRHGVGVTTVCEALGARGVCVTTDGDADVRVLVVVEALKPEERARLADGVAVVVLNKADLCKSRPDGPIVEANRLAAAIRAQTGVRTIAMSALLAVAGCGPVDAETVDALHMLCRAPADLSSVDAFVAVDHPLSAGTRARLLERLDRFGLAHALTALARGADAATLPELMSELSNVADLLAALRSASAAVRYRRVRDAILGLRCLATGSGTDGLIDWLAGDEPVLAMMAAAVDVLECDGLRVDAGDSPEAHMGRAVHWREYGRGPVGPLHRDCCADVVRGSLRLLDAGTS